MVDFSRLTLPTPQLLLRPLRPADAAAVFALHADAEAMRYWATPPWADPAQAEALIRSDLAAMAAGESLRLALTRPGEDRVLGLCTLFAWQPASRRAEIGYLLARDCWGRGLMHEALGALLEHGFGALDLNRVAADIDPRNGASERTLRRLGFQQEGVLRERWIVAGEVSDTGLYGLLRRDWLAQRAAGPAAGQQRG